MRHVLHLLFQDYGTGGKAEAVGEDAPLNILKIMLSLLCLALDKFPGVFHDNGISSIPYFFARVMQLVSLPKLRPHSKKLVDTLDRLATQCLAQDTETCAIIYTDLAVLVQDVDMAFSGMLDSMPQDKCVTLQSFNHCFAKMSGGGDCMDSSRGHIYGQLQCITLTLESETAALDVTAATARLLSRILLESPSFAHCMPGIALLRPLHALFPYGSDEHQAAMMQAIHAEAAVLCPREISARQLLCTVLDMLEGIATSRHQKIMSGGLSQACVHCLELSVCKLTQTEWGALHVYAPRLLQALSHLAVHSTDKGVQVSLLSILVVLMECQPSLQLPALRIAGAMISAAVESGVVVDHFQQPFAHILNCRTATRSSGQGSAYSATGTLHVPAEVGEELLAMPRRCCPATGNVPDDSSPDVRALAVAALPFVFYMEPSRAKPAAHTERSSAAQCLQELSGAVGDEALIVRREVGKSLQVMIKSTLPGTRWELQFADAYYSMCRNYGVEVLALRCSEILLNSAEAVSSCKSNINAATSFPSSFALDQSALQPFMVLITDKNERPEVQCSMLDFMGTWLHAQQDALTVAELITGQSRVMEYVGRRLGSKPQLLPELADMLEIQSSEIAQKLVPSVLPRLVISQDMQLLGALAKCLQQSLKDMLVNYGHHTVAFLLLEGQQDIDEYAAFMLRHTEVEFDDLMKSSLRSVLKEVIWCAGKDISEDDISAAVADFLHEEQMIWLLTELVGDRMKRGKEAELAEQLQALRCLSLLIVFVGRHLADFVPLMMTLLARATELSAPDVQLQALAAWSLFIKQLSTRAPQMLRIHAVRIAVILTAFLDSGGNATLAASAAMEELVISNRANLDEQCLCEFPPLPSLPSLEAVNRALVQARGDLSAPDHLLMLAEGLVPHRPRQYTGQPLAVKAVTMMEIKCFLQQHQEWRLSLAARQKQIPGADPWHHALDFLVAVLLKSCDPEVRSALSHRVHLRGAECLGSVGAVDPAKLSKVETFKILISKAQSADQICESEAELAKQVLSSLANLLSGSSDLEISEAATFGIQELLAQFNDSTGAGESGDSLYRSIEPELQAVVRPYLSTKYQLQSSAPGTIKSPIFGPHTLSFRRWLFLWLKQLTDLMGPERATIFKACTGVARHDISIMLLLLPHAVLNVLASGDEAAAAAVLMEIHTVLKGCTETGNMQTDWHLLLQALFTLFDKLKTWVLRVDNQGTISSGNNSGKRAAISSGHFSEGKACVEKMLQEVDHRVLAKASYRCGAYARAMQYFEASLRSQGGGLNPAARVKSSYQPDDVSFLIAVYSELEEPDGLAGFTRLRHGGPTNSDMILAAERRGSWSEALTLYEQALQQEADEYLAEDQTPMNVLSHHATGQLDCLLHLGHLQAVLKQAEGLALHAAGEARCNLAVRGIAASWRMGRWHELESCLKVAHEHPHLIEAKQLWEVRIGEMLISMRDRDMTTLKAQLEAARHEIMGPMSAAAMESHSRAYPYVVKLHMLQEIEDAITHIPTLTTGSNATSFGPIQLKQSFQKLHWRERLACMQTSLNAQEPVLALRRQMAALSGMQQEVGRCFLLQAKLCRKTGHYDSAAISCLEAVSLRAEGSSLEYSKLLWSTGESHRAINTLEDALSTGDINISDSAHAAAANKAKMLLQLARWMAVTGQGGQKQVTEHFENATRSGQSCEKPHFYYGKYLDQLMQDAKRRQGHGLEPAPKLLKDRLGGKSKVTLGEDQHHLVILPQVLFNYASAARHGHRLIMQSLPRLLTLWYDFGGSLSTFEPKDGNEQQNVGQAAEEVSECFWALVAVVRSKYKQRSKAATEIMTRAKKNLLSSRGGSRPGPKYKELFSQFPALVDQLISLANYIPDQRVRRFDLTREGGLTHVTRMNPDAVILPVLNMLTPELPSNGIANASHDAFSGRVTTIQSINKEVEVMASLQKPKKIVFMGSDAQPYTFLAKPKDDLRKDQRLMELATALNRLFVKHPASRQRNLYLRTFNVVPLTEDCGIIQWVNFTIGFRHCCQAAYAAPGKSLKAALQGCKSMYEKYEKAPPAPNKWSTWYNEVLEMFPPMMHSWWLKEFRTPAHWFDARLRFTRTTAVWSMVGHILGLGDRHGENLLIDRATGDCVHVDFSCLFDKGLTLEKPEMVPFRLTQNIIDSFGPTGIEGVFRSVCSITLQVLRAHRETILSILETFVHDPLVEWDRPAPRSGPAQQASAESENDQARDALQITDGRLSGTLVGVSSRPSLPLSPEGHAHRLIEEAIDRDNLGRMYIWWMVWF
eukprot:jgi/Tetstr1/444501/TSEL_032380.t1